MSDTYSVRNSHPWYPEDLRAEISPYFTLKHAQDKLRTTLSSSVKMREQVPQTDYTAKTSSFIPRVIASYRVQQSDGISLDSILRNNAAELVGGFDPAFTEIDSSKVSMRILWPGYNEYSRQITIKRGSRQDKHISLAKTAGLIAKQMVEVVKMYENTHTNLLEWKVGEGFIELKDLILVDVLRVSKSSIQPRFDVIRRSG